MLVLVAGSGPQRVRFRGWVSSGKGRCWSRPSLCFPPASSFSSVPCPGPRPQPPAPDLSPVSRRYWAFFSSPTPRHSQLAPSCSLPQTQRCSEKLAQVTPLESRSHPCSRPAASVPMPVPWGLWGDGGTRMEGRPCPRHVGPTITDWKPRLRLGPPPPRPHLSLSCPEPQERAHCDQLTPHGRGQAEWNGVTHLRQSGHLHRGPLVKRDREGGGMSRHPFPEIKLVPEICSCPRSQTNNCV